MSSRSGHDLAFLITESLNGDAREQRLLITVLRSFVEVKVKAIGARGGSHRLQDTQHKARLEVTRCTAEEGKNSSICKRSSILDSCW